MYLYSVMNHKQASAKGPGKHKDMGIHSLAPNNGIIAMLLACRAGLKPKHLALRMSHYSGRPRSNEHDASTLR